MKKKGIKLIGLVLVIVMMTNAFTQNIKAEEGFAYEFEENCKSYYMFDPADGTVVYSVNADEVLPMASLTKIMTFIVASENIPDIENTVITVSEHAVTELYGTDSSLSGVYAGEQLTGLQLLNMMMIPSGNDAALALQIYYDEVIAGETFDGANADTPFVKLMNQKASELGCEYTHFVNPHGLHDEQHYSTARDLAKIVQYALTLPNFKEIVKTTKYTIPATNQCKEERVIEATNKMLREDYADGMYYYEYADGIKTGSHDEAGYCIAASASKEGQSYVVIALGSPMLSEEGEYIDYHGEMVDAAQLFEWAFQNLSRTEICEQEEVITEIPLQYAWKKETLSLLSEESISTILPNGQKDNLEIEFDIPESVEAPVTEGEILGTVSYSYEGEWIATVNLKAAETVKKSFILYALEVLKHVLCSVWFWVIVVLAGTITISIVLKKKRKKRHFRNNKRKRRIRR